MQTFYPVEDSHLLVGNRQCMSYTCIVSITVSDTTFWFTFCLYFVFGSIDKPERERNIRVKSYGLLSLGTEVSRRLDCYNERTLLLCSTKLVYFLQR